MAIGTAGTGAFLFAFTTAKNEAAILGFNCAAGEWEGKRRMCSRVFNKFAADFWFLFSLLLNNFVPLHSLDSKHHVRR